MTDGALKEASIVHIIVVGCGRVGSIAARVLARQEHSVVVIDQEPRAFARLGNTFTGKQLQGFALDREILTAAGIESSDALVAVTNGDNTNIVAARIAKEVFRVPIVVARMNDPLRAEIYRRFGVATFSTSQWGASQVVDLVTRPHVHQEQSFGSGDLRMIEAQVAQHFAGKPVTDVEVPGEIRVASIVRLGKAVLPVSGTKFEAGDIAHILVIASSLDKLSRMFGWK
jgi:trk system potassium uptake protein TrkA